ncbi:LEPR-XLL domain-containing protein, partial [candidate division KSB1 bacterium]|nr:LEPR-XLL domain-containing protein [candidate division KSB1 bacterium]
MSTLFNVNLKVLRSFLGRIGELKKGHSISNRAIRRKSRFRKKTKQVMSRRMGIEPLEPRVLLSGDVSVMAAADADLLLRLDLNNSNIVQVMDANTDVILASESLDNLDGSSGYGVKIDGTGHDVCLTIDDSILNSEALSEAGGVVFEAGTGEDSLIVSMDELLSFDEQDLSGSLHDGLILFSGVENLIDPNDMENISSELGSDDPSESIGRAKSLTDSPIQIKTTEADSQQPLLLIPDTGDGMNTLDFSGYASDLTIFVHADGTVAVTDGLDKTANINQAENIVTSSGVNTLVFEDGASLAGSISGDGSVRLDYSAYTTDVFVDLGAGTATGIGGFFNLAGVIGGEGNDTLFGPSADTTWTIDGVDSGHIGDFNFSNIENLLGAADNEDTYVFEDGGSLSGLIDGGAGGFDSLVLDGGEYGSVTYKAFDAHSGTIDRDGDLISYAGLEPITDNSSTTDRVITLSVLGDEATLSEVGSQLKLSGSGFEEHTFDKPSNSLTINLGTGNDTLHVLDLGTIEFSLTINGGYETDAGFIDGSDAVIFEN